MTDDIKQQPHAAADDLINIGRNDSAMLAVTSAQQICPTTPGLSLLLAAPVSRTGATA